MTGSGAGSLRVLLAEPRPAHRAILEALLQREGHVVWLAPEAPLALRALADEAFDAIVIDAALPVVPDDLRVASLAPGTVLVGAFESEDGVDEAGARDMGFDDAVARPFGLSHVRTIESAVQRETSGSLSHADILRRALGRPELVQRLASLACETLPLALERLRLALEGGTSDALEVAAAAHAVKGSVANFGASAARTCALRMEHAALEGDIERGRDNWLLLKEHVAGLLEALAAEAAGAAR